MSSPHDVHCLVYKAIHPKLTIQTTEHTADITAQITLLFYYYYHYYYYYLLSNYSKTPAHIFTKLGGNISWEGIP